MELEDLCNFNEALSYSLHYDQISGRWGLAEQEQEQGDNMNEKYDEIANRLHSLPTVKYKDLSKEDLAKVCYISVPRKTMRAFSSRVDTIYNVFYIIDGKYLDEYCFGEEESIEKNVLHVLRSRWEEHNK